MLNYYDNEAWHASKLDMNGITNSAKKSLRGLLDNITPKESTKARLSFQHSNILDSLMHEKGVSKKQLTEAISKRPSEITKWLSGEHNFIISTLAMLSTFFNQPILIFRSPKNI